MSGYEIYPVYFRIEIQTTNILGGSPPNDGFIDHLTIPMYGQLTNFPSTLALSRAKCRANYRYLQLINNLSETQSIAHVLDRNNGGATEDAPGTVYELTVSYSRPNDIYTRNELFGVPGDPTEFDEILYDEDAVQRQAIRTFCFDYVTNSQLPKDPLTSANQGYEWISEVLNVGGSTLVGTIDSKINTLLASVTVTKIPNTFNP